jgi:hypothetical protein
VVGGGDQSAQHVGDGAGQELRRELPCVKLPLFDLG